MKCPVAGVTGSCAYCCDGEVRDGWHLGWRRSLGVTVERTMGGDFYWYYRYEVSEVRVRGKKSESRTRIDNGPPIYDTDYVRFPQVAHYHHTAKAAFELLAALGGTLDAVAFGRWKEKK